MNALDALNKIKTMLGMETEVKFTDAKLEDGTIISYDKLEVGGLVELIAEDGTKSTLTVGDYTLEDGTLVSIDENGLITNVTPVSEVPVEGAEIIIETPEVETPETPETTTPEIDKVKELEDRISALEDAMNSMMTNMTEVKQSYEDKTIELETKLAEISNAPATESITIKQTEAKPQSRFDKMSNAIDLAKKQINK
jgi:hypothetical protein